MEKNETVLEMAKDDDFCEIAEQYVQQLYANDKKAFDKATKIVNLLGLGGLWRGQQLAVMMVDKTIKEVGE